MSHHSAFENGRLTVERLFQAPREAVFDAWINTSKVELWWGCGFAESVRSEVDPVVGGSYTHRMTLTGPGEYLHKGLITAYDPPTLLAYDLHDRFHAEPMGVRVEFIEEGGQTRVRLTQDGLNATYRGFVSDGWTRSLDQLAVLLKQWQFEMEENTK